ncbi:MAG: tetratricopeptide repeat protein [Sphingomonas sp.]|nr:tetratricopeptide repeat protein [Sphingomonas sp.]
MIVPLPVTMSGLRPLVHAKINGHEAVFVADSGAWFSMISPGSAAEYELALEPVPIGFRLQGVGGAVVPRLTTVKTFTIAGVPLPKVQFLVGGSEFGSVGLLGQNFLGLEDAEFDLAHGMIRLMREHGCTSKANLAYWAPAGGIYSELSTEGQAAKPGHIFASVYVNGVKLRAMFDTGASTSFISRAAAGRFGLKPDAPGVTPAGGSSGIGRHFVQTWIGPIQSVKIGDEEVRNTRIRFGGDLQDIDMLIGADFFLSHHVYWAQKLDKLFFTFNGGRVFDLRDLDDGQTDASSDAGHAPVAAGADAEAVPTDADGFSRRGGARASRGELKEALADFDQAIKLAPDTIDYLRQRAQLHAQMRQPLRAVEDLERILKIKPDDVDAHLMRAAMRQRLDHDADVGSDLDAAAAAAAPSSDRRFAIAAAYQEAGNYPRAIAQFDLWIAAHRDDVRRPIALNGRCWARALSGTGLDLALKDCNAALSAMPRNPSFLDSRGLVRLRSGQYAQAIADYDQALAANGKIAWSLYGRGIAKLRLGQKEAGEADLAKAKALELDLPDRAKKLGVAP